MEAKNTSKRKMPSESMDLNAIGVPYMYIHEQFGYSVQSIYRRFMTESDADLGTYPDTFPNNIQEHFWIQPGEPTVKPWISLGQLNNGLYFYFTAFSTNKDGRFYVNTVTEEVSVPKPNPVKFVTPSNPMFPNIGLSGASFLAEIPSAPIPIPVPTVVETDAVSTVTVVKSITPVTTGHMNLWLSCRFSDIIEYSMDTVTYEKYMAETLPTE
jgi:hypothetical protein